MTDGAHGLDFTVRRATPEDDEGIVRLLSRTLGWEDDPRHRALFEWKHRSNPFGSSPGWVAEDDEGLIGSRTFMRWQFQVGSETVTAVRAVDTATHPRAQGRGVFRTLTMTGVEELTASGVGWVFNTPNAKSAPGYLSMGWQAVGRLKPFFRPSRVVVLPRLLSARKPGDLWSTPTSIGDDAASVLHDREALAELLAEDTARTEAIRTLRTPEFFQWRYGRSPIGYRALLAGSNLSDGVLLFRLRRRGDAVEAVILDVILPGRDRDRRRAKLLRRLLRGGEADYALALGPSHPRWWLPVPGRGPLLTWRPLARAGSMPELPRWDLRAGDIELF
jgi:predicted N-acetyltransferase YhbS